MVELFANSGDPDQMPHSVASELGLHCLPFTLLVVSGWVKRIIALDKTLFQQKVLIHFLFFKKKMSVVLRRNCFPRCPTSFREETRKIYLEEQNSHSATLKASSKSLLCLNYH